MFIPLDSMCLSLSSPQEFIMRLSKHILYMYTVYISIIYVQNFIVKFVVFFVPHIRARWSSCQLINKIIVCSLTEMFEFNGKSEKKPDREKKKKFPVNCIVPALCTCRDQSFVGFSSCPNKFCCPTKFQCMFFCVRFRRKHNFVSERFFSLYKFWNRVENTFEQWNRSIVVYSTLSGTSAILSCLSLKL